MAQRRTQAERTEATRKLLLEKAYDLFGNQGYSKTSMDDLVSQCNMTRGALYHHFKNKKDLFKTLVLQEEQKMHKTVASAEGKTTKERLDNSIDVFFDYCANPQFRQIVLLDGPAVLGGEHWTKPTRHARSHRLEDLVPLILPEDADDSYKEAFTSILLGGMIDAAKLIARAKDSDVARQGARMVVHQIISHFSSLKTAS